MTKQELYQIHGCVHERENPQMINDARWQTAHHILHQKKWTPRGRYIWAEREMKYAARAKPLGSYNVLEEADALLASI